MANTAHKRPPRAILCLTRPKTRTATKTNQHLPIHIIVTWIALDILNGQHVFSKLIPPLLFFADGLLCELIIWKVPCKLSPFIIASLVIWTAS